MSVNYEIWLTDDNGNRLAFFEHAISFAYTATTHAEGFFSVRLPGTFPREFLRICRRVLIFRRPPGGAMGLDFVGFIRRIATDSDSDGHIVRTVQGPGANWLLSGRIVYAAAGSPNAQKTGTADDVMKAVVREQMGTSAATARQYDSSYFSVQADSTDGPTLTKGFAYRNVLEVLQELSATSRQAGAETFFQVLPADTARFQFVTATGQPGRDLRGSGLVFGLEYGNIRNCRLTEDWGDECNFGYGLGSGEGAARIIQTAEDTTRSGIAWYGRREIAKDARMQDTTNGVMAAAQAAITERRPVLTFGGEIVSTAGALYGVHWRNGDRVNVTYDGLQFDSLIRAVSVNVDENGKESIGARLEAYL